MHTHTDAYEIIGDVDAAGPFVFTCEHASNRLPWHSEVGAGDRMLLDDHWGWDVGAADVTRALVEHFHARGVLARFSRLLIDANRRPDSDTLIIASAGGIDIDINVDLDENERKRRVEELYAPYHAAVDFVVEQRVARAEPVHLVAIHSFTPSYLGHKRAMEIGVLFDDFDEDAFHVESALAEEGFVTALNAPYSGKGPDGLIYAARHHGRNHHVKYLELEIRQDLIDTEAKARDVALRIARGLEPFRP